MQKVRPVKRPSGFTLVEIIVTLVIIGILATIALTTTGAPREQAFDEEARANLKLIAAAENLAKVEKSHYVEALDTASINRDLNLNLPVNQHWNYSVSATPNTSFSASAARIVPVGKWSRNWCMGQNDPKPYNTTNDCP